MFGFAREESTKSDRNHLASQKANSLNELSECVFVLNWAHTEQLPSDWINWPNLFKYFIHSFIHLSIYPFWSMDCQKLCIDFICGVAFIDSNESKTNYWVCVCVRVWIPTFTIDSNEIQNIRICKKIEAFHQQLRCV